MRVLLPMVCVLGLLAQPAAADSVYEWTDAKGMRHYSDKAAVPRANRVNTELLKSKPVPPEPPERIAPSFRAQVRARCDQARERLALYAQSGEIIEHTATGVEYTLPEHQRSRVMQELRRDEQRYCSPGAVATLWRQRTQPPPPPAVPPGAEPVPITPSGFLTGPD